MKGLAILHRQSHSDLMDEIYTGKRRTQVDYKTKSPEEFFEGQPLTARLEGSTTRREENEMERKINDTSLQRYLNATWISESVKGDI